MICKKSKPVKTGMRKVHQELVAWKYMVKLSELNPELPEAVKGASFQHYFPWRTVQKDSVSTPMHMVVDPTISSLNLILPKGENLLGSILDILIQSRARPFIWS